MKITINGWDEFQPRKDRKAHTWFRVNNTIADSETLFGLSGEQKWFWICLLAHASKKQSATVDFNAAYFENHFGVPIKKMNETLRVLMDRGAITFEPGNQSVTDGNQSVTDGNQAVATGITTNKQTDKQTIQTNKQPAAQFDFESLYKRFPRHEGKDPGMRSLGDQIRSEDEFNQFAAAVDHYADLVKKRCTEPKFIKLWSSFVGTKRSGFPWREYVARPPELDAPVTPGQETPEERNARIMAEYEARRKRDADMFGETAS